jgi:PKD repeat protein
VLNVSQTNTVTIKDSSIRAVHYYWTFGDGTATDTTPGNQAHTYANTGIYTIRLITCDSCGCDTFSRVVNVNANGISEINGFTDVNLYPNPASNSSTISITSAESMDVILELNNMLGATVQSAKAQIVTGENRIVVDLSGVTAGIYTLTIRASTGALTRKLDVIK